MKTLVRLMLIDALDMIEGNTPIVVRIHSYDKEGYTNLYTGDAENFPFYLLKYLWHIVETFGDNKEGITILLREDNEDDPTDAI